MDFKSFIIKKELLSKEQLINIRNHKTVANIEEYKQWIIEENDKYICGYTEG